LPTRQIEPSLTEERPFSRIQAEDEELASKWEPIRDHLRTLACRSVPEKIPFLETDEYTTDKLYDIITTADPGRIDDLDQRLLMKLDPKAAEETEQEAFYPSRVREEYYNQKARQEARRLLASEDTGPLEPLGVSELEDTITEYLIDDVIELGTVGFLVGEWGTAKTFMAIDWACCLATETAWLGRDVPRRGKVLYIAAEGGAGLKRRVRGWEQHHGVKVDDEHLVILPKAVQFGNPEAVRQLIGLVHKLKIDFVIIDTLARSINGLSENDTQDMGIYIDAMYELRDACEENGTTALTLHHKGKDRSKGARGSSRLISDVDFNYETDRSGEPAAEQYELRCKKMKDDVYPAPVNFRLESLDLRTYPAKANGEPHTSCVVIETEAAFDDSQGVSGKNWKAGKRAGENAGDDYLGAIALLGGQATAQMVASELGIARNRASAKLNEFVEAGELAKTGTRPVAFKTRTLEMIEHVTGGQEDE
jgi:hypothetical protein